MDSNAMEVIQLASGARFNVLPVSNGNVIMVPVQASPPPLISQSPVGMMTMSLPQQVQAPHVPRGDLTTPTMSLPVTTATVEQLYHHNGSAGMGIVFDGGGGGMISDTLALSSADEALADLQPEDSEGDEEAPVRPTLTPEQKKLEFMAALGLVPPAILEEIHRRQQLCRAEYGNWWDRLHSTDFCLVPKTESALQSLQILAEEMSSATSQEDITHVAAGPDAGSLVEQITYLTSWPQPTSSDAVNTVEVVTQQTTADEQALVEHQHQQELAAAAQALKEHYLTLVSERQQVDEQALHVTIQQLASSFAIPSSS